MLDWSDAGSTNTMWCLLPSPSLRVKGLYCILCPWKSLEKLAKAVASSSLRHRVSNRPLQEASPAGGWKGVIVGGLGGTRWSKSSFLYPSLQQQQQRGLGFHEPIACYLPILFYNAGCTCSHKHHIASRPEENV